MPFEDFWTWLTEQPRTLSTLGAQQGLVDLPEELPDVAADAVPAPEGELPLPGDRQFSIHGYLTADGHVRVPSGNYHPFTLEAALATWHRFHGLRATTAKLLADGVALPGLPIHLMTSSYIRPTHMAAPYPQNWLDCPQPITSPCYIAAAIRVYCNSLPNAHTIYPAA